MPIYDYKCKDCGKTSEIRVHSSEDDNVRCPDCAGENLEKLFSSSYMVKTDQSVSSTTCCGSPGSCDTPGSCCHSG